MPKVDGERRAGREVLKDWTDQAPEHRIWRLKLLGKLEQDYVVRMSFPLRRGPGAFIAAGGGRSERTMGQRLRQQALESSWVSFFINIL